MTMAGCRRAAAGVVLCLALASAAWAEVRPPPLPAIRAPLASRDLLLDVTRAGSRLVAVGARGHVLLSDDGRNWQQAAVPVRSTLTAVSFADAEHGWAVGHDATIIATRDGGRTWALQHVDAAGDTPLLDVLFVDKQRGWAVGNFGLFLETRDGGGTWTAVEAAVIADDELTLHAIARLGSGDLLVVGERGRIIRSRDGGRTWRRLRAPDRLTVFGVAPWGQRGALICGLRGRAWLREQLDRGDWRAIGTGTGESIYGCTTDGRGSALLVGAAGLRLEVMPRTLRVEALERGTDGDLAAAIADPAGWITVGEGGAALLAVEANR